MPTRALLLVNRGARKAAESLDDAVRHLGELGFDLIEESAAEPDRLPDLIRRHRHEVDRVIVGGGDGTLSAAVEGLVDAHLPLGILPLGTANNLARTLGLPTDLREACDVIARAHTRRIDLGRVNDKHFFTTASLGLSVRITEELSGESKRRWGVLAYGVAAIRVLLRSRPFHARITWPGGERDSRTLQIVVGNGRYYGSAMTVAEDAAIDDARLDLYTLEVRHWWELLALVPALKRGRHGAKEGVELFHGREFTVTTREPHDIDVDGELGARTPATFRVLPGALAVYVPAPA
jgi:diacylglycerol kinase (ATP)